MVRPGQLRLGEEPCTPTTLYVHDDRYSVPNLVFLGADSTAKAKELAHSELYKSEHYLAVDVLEG
jgi:hypothetical protein